MTITHILHISDTNVFKYLYNSDSITAIPRDACDMFYFALVRCIAFYDKASFIFITVN